MTLLPPSLSFLGVMQLSPQNESILFQWKEHWYKTQDVTNITHVWRKIETWNILEDL